MNITAKVTSLGLCLVFFTGFSLYFVTKQNARETLEAQIGQGLEWQSLMINDKLARFLEERASDMSDFADDPRLLLPEASKTLVKTAANNPLYESFSLFDTSRIRIADTKGLALGKKHSENQYWAVLKTKDKAIDISFSESLQKPIMHFAALVRDGQNQKKGVLVARIPLEKLEKVLDGASVPESQNNAANIEILDREGRILYSRQKNKTLLSEKHPLTDLILEKETKGGIGKLFSVNGKLYAFHIAGTNSDLGAKGWILLNSLPAANAYAPIRELSDKILMRMALIMAVAALISIVAARIYTRPIVQLSKVAKEYGKGNFDVEINFKTSDERQLLAYNMARMAASLKEKIADINTANKQLLKRVDTIGKQKEEIESQNGRIEAQKKEIETALNKLERKNKQIVSSIGYAKKMQTAMLPPLGDISDELKHSFVWYKPKDIVSGDFYWFQKVNPKEGGEKLILAAIDCTGHGVPGAFMTVIADNLLYQIVGLGGEHSPTEALRQLNEGVKTILRQGAPEGSANKEGMDIAFCSIDLENRFLKFAGARRPLLLVRQGEAREFKGSKISIGGDLAREERAAADKSLEQEIKEYHVELLEKDSIYLFSDGITDQFGGDDDKKFTKKRLKQLLADMAGLEMQDQKTYLDASLSDWMQGAEQTDDMLLMGVFFDAFPLPSAQQKSIAFGIMNSN